MLSGMKYQQMCHVQAAFSHRLQFIHSVYMLVLSLWFIVSANDFCMETKLIHSLTHSFASHSELLEGGFHFYWSFSYIRQRQTNSCKTHTKKYTTKCNCLFYFFFHTCFLFYGLHTKFRYLLRRMLLLKLTGET